MLKSHTRSIDQTIRTLRFWQQSNLDHELPSLTEVGRPIPQDPSVGLERLTEVLGRRKCGYFHEAHMFYIIILLRMCLNAYTICCDLHMLWHEGPIAVDEGLENYNMTMTRTAVTECFGKECIVHHVSRLRAWWVMSIFEAWIVLPSAFLTLLAAFSFLLCKHIQMCRRSDESSSTSSDDDDVINLWPQKPTTDSFILRLPYDSSWYFVLAPRFVAGFSSIALLTFCSSRTTWTVVVRGIGEFHLRYFWASTLPCFFMNHFAKSDELLKPHKIKEQGHVYVWRWTKRIAILLACFVLALCSLQSLMIKLTHLHYVGSTDFRTWPLSSWFLFMGFINQIVGAFEFLDSEMTRLMLFAFGGADGRLGKREMARCIMYFRLIGRQLVMEIGDDTTPFDVISELAYINVDRLQSLIMSEYRDLCIDNFGEKRMEFLSELHTSKDAEDFFQFLQAVKKTHEFGDLMEAERLLHAAKEKRYDSLRKLRSHQFKLAGINDVSSLDDFNNMSESDYESLTEKLRLALETQVKIEELLELDLPEFIPERATQSHTADTGGWWLIAA